MGKRVTRTYTLEFKQQAVQMAKEIGHMKAADKLGIPEGTLYSWKKDRKVLSSTLSTRNGVASGDPKESPEAELKRLRAEVQELKKVNHILKAAAAFFSQDHLK